LQGRGEIFRGKYDFQDIFIPRDKKTPIIKRARIFSEARKYDGKKWHLPGRNG
jgi:hypothetical protein